MSVFFIFLLKFMLYFDLRPGPKILFQGNTPEGSDTFQRPVIERDRVGGLRLMIWEKVKVPLCHYSHALEESKFFEFEFKGDIRNFFFFPVHIMKFDENHLQKILF